MTLLFGFYLGGAFYVGMLAQAEHEDMDALDVIRSAACWPYGLYQILKGE